MKITFEAATGHPEKIQTSNTMPPAAQPWDFWPARRAFTLLEVIIACAIFFMMVFAVLELVTRGLAAARSLQQREPDAGMVASIYCQTNILAEDGDSGDFEKWYEGLYPDYSWARETVEVGSNSLFRVDFVVYQGNNKRRGVSETHMSILLFRPGSPPGSASKSFGGGLGGP